MSRTTVTARRAAAVLSVATLLALSAPLTGAASAAPSAALSAVRLPGRQQVFTLRDVPAGTVVPRARLLAPSGAQPHATTAQFQVNYDSGFNNNPDAKAAFQAAIDIWSQNVTSSEPILINASFAALNSGRSGGFILGGAGPSVFVINSAGLQANTAYPVALANAIGGKDNFTAAQDTSGGGGEDIDAQFASDYPNFYFGTDGNPGANQVDFESVVLHEIGHGLGFLGATAADTNAKTGTIGLIAGTVNYPTIWDRFVLTGDGRSVIDKGQFPDNSNATYQALIGSFGGPFFDSPEVRQRNNDSARQGMSARLFAPDPYQDGSSYSHFDEMTYPAGNVNSLMTPKIGFNESIHSPGPLMLAVFDTLGWTTPQSQSGSTATATPTSTATATPTSTASGTPVAPEPGPTTPAPVVPEVGVPALLPGAGLLFGVGLWLRRRRVGG